MSNAAMASLHFCLPHVLFAISCMFSSLQWRFGDCKLQHDPGGAAVLELHDTHTVVGKYFNYTLPSPVLNKADSTLLSYYRVSEVGSSSIPRWMLFNDTLNTFHGVPLITEEGFYLIRVALVSPSGNSSKILAQDVFAIDVNMEPSKELSRINILDGLGAQPPHALYKAQQLSESITCRRNEIKTKMSVIFDININSLNGSGRVTLLSKLSNFVTLPMDQFIVSSKHSRAISRLHMDHVIVAGPGNIHNPDVAGDSDSAVVSWPLPCATQTLINQFPKVMARNIASGHLRQATSYDVISWYISSVAESEAKTKERRKREAGMTIAPTPIPSQTASAITVTTMFTTALSSFQFTQTPLTMFSTSVTSTLFPSLSSHDVTRRVSSVSTESQTMGSSVFVPSQTLSTISLDVSSLFTLSPSQISLLTSAESSTSQTYFVTDSAEISDFTSLFSSSMSQLISPSILISQTSATAQSRTPVLSSFHTPTFLSTIFESSEDITSIFYQTSTSTPSSVTSMVSSLQQSSSILGSPPSSVTSVVSTLQQSSSILGSPSLFPSSVVATDSRSSRETISLQISTSVELAVSSVLSRFVTESLRTFSDDVGLSQSTVTTDVVSLQLSSSIYFPTLDSSMGRSYDMTSSLEMSSVRPPVSETSFIFHTSSDLSTDTILPSSDIVRISSFGITSSTIFTTMSPLEISSIVHVSSPQSEFTTSSHSTSTSVALSSTLLQPASTTFYTLMSTQMMSSETASLQSSLESSERFLSSIDVTESPSLVVLSTSFIETRMDRTVIQVSSTGTMLLSSSLDHSESLSTMSTLSSYDLPETASASSITPTSAVETSSLGATTPFISTETIDVPSSQVRTEIFSTVVTEQTSILTTRTEVSSLPVSAGTSSTLSTFSLILTGSGSSTDFGTSTQVGIISSMLSSSATGMVSSSVITPSTSKSADITVTALSSSESHFSLFPTQTGELFSTSTLLESSFLTEFLPSPSLTLYPEVSTQFTFVSTVSSTDVRFSLQSSTGNNETLLASSDNVFTSTIPSMTFSTVEPTQSSSHLDTSDVSGSEIASTLILQTSAPSLSSTRGVILSESSVLTYITLSSNMLFESSQISLFISSDSSMTSSSKMPPFSTVTFATSAPSGLSSHQIISSSEISSVQHQTSDRGLSSTSLFFSEVQSESQISSVPGTSTHLPIPSSSEHLIFTVVTTSTSVQASFSQTVDMSSPILQPSMTGVPTSVLTSMEQTGRSQTPSVGETSLIQTPDLSTSLLQPKTDITSIMIPSSTVEVQSSLPTPSLSTPISGQPTSTLMSSQLLTQSPLTSPVSPSSSALVLSSTELTPSSTFALTPSPSVPMPTSLTGSTPVLPSLPSSSDGMVSSSMAVSPSQIQPTQSFSSQVQVVSSSSVTTLEPTTQPPEITTEPPNQPPSLQHPIDEIILALGDVLQFPIPEDTFLDPEDGLTPNLQLTLLSSDNEPTSPSSWIQLNQADQILIGVPLDANLINNRNEFLLSATDSEGLVAYDAFVIDVRKSLTDYTHQFIVTLENDFESFVSNGNIIVTLCERISSFLDDANTEAFSISSLTEGSVVLSYSNKTVSRSECDAEAVDEVLSSLAFTNGTPVHAFQESLLPDFFVTDVERIFLNLCAVTTLPPVTNVTHPFEDESNILLVTLVPACVVSFLLLLCFFIICCFYKRKRGGEEFLLREEKPIYAKNRKPIYLDGELHDKDLHGVSNPVILPMDVELIKSSRPRQQKDRQSSTRPQPPPPQYRLPDYAKLNIEMEDFEHGAHGRQLPEYTSQPILNSMQAGNTENGRHPPLYRLPPPYQSQDIGFFDESDI